MKPVFNMSDLSISYGKRDVVKNINLTIERNSITAIVGPSGCGKSTLLKSLNGLLEFEDLSDVKGDILFDGHNIYRDKLDKKKLRKNIAMLFQNPGAFPFSIRKNLDIAFDEWHSESRIFKDNLYENLLKKVSLWKEIEGNLDMQANELSGGQQQRLCLVRSLLTDPDIILLDEPCSALDPISTKVIEKMLVELKKTKTIVIVTHDLAQAKRLADDLVVMWPITGAGNIVENGNARDIFENAQTHIAREYLAGELPDIC